MSRREADDAADPALALGQQQLMLLELVGWGVRVQCGEVVVVDVRRRVVGSAGAFATRITSVLVGRRRDNVADHPLVGTATLGDFGLRVGILRAMRSGRVRLAGSILAAIGALAGCGTTPAPTAPEAPAAAAAGSPSPPATSEGPSDAARMICDPEEQDEIAHGLGLTLHRPATPVWTAPVYSCTYQFKAGPLILSVRELTAAGETTAYFTGARAAAAASTDVPGLGEAAFATKDGSVYVRKDFKVLKVDVSKLPASVGKTPISRADAAVSVAQLIMGCWTGT